MVSDADCCTVWSGFKSWRRYSDGLDLCRAGILPQKKTMELRRRRGASFAHSLRSTITDIESVKEALTGILKGSSKVNEYLLKCSENNHAYCSVLNVLPFFFEDT
ncbi:hypothetical protein TNCV_5082771 [Trichonephila clavipes]|nr:hypothetical protein TNCV_5082771 [Trichonephila clavipes]